MQRMKGILPSLLKLYGVRRATGPKVLAALEAMQDSEKHKFSASAVAQKFLAASHQRRFNTNAMDRIREIAALEEPAVAKKQDDNLYIFISIGKKRRYKFCVYAKTLKDAKKYRAKILDLYLTHSNQYALAVMKNGVQLDRYQMEKNAVRINEVAILSEELPSLVLTHGKVLIGNQQYNEYYGRRMGAPSVGLAVFDGIQDVLLDDFDVEYTKFADYPAQVEKRIQQLNHVNSPKIISCLEQYVREFFELNPPSKKAYDPIKLAADKKRLYEKYIEPEHIDFCGLDTRENAKYHSVTKFISATKEAITKFKDNYGVTPLMYHVARPGELGSYIADTLKRAEAAVLKLLANGADVNETDEFGRTALMYVVIAPHVLDRFIGGVSTLPGRERFAKLLLGKGADPRVKDKAGKTALDYYKEFIEEKDHPAINLLKSALEHKKRATYPALLQTFGVRPDDVTAPRVADALRAIKNSDKCGHVKLVAHQFLGWANKHNRRFDKKAIVEIKEISNIKYKK